MAESLMMTPHLGSTPSRASPDAGLPWEPWQQGL